MESNKETNNIQESSISFNLEGKKVKIKYEDEKGGLPDEAKKVTKEMNDIRIDKAKLRKAHKIVINGIEVLFPYKPYECQILYMEKVIESCKTGKYAILESPTGTGKTLCLLCASLAWLKAKRQELQGTSEEPPVIYYTSRTHSQLTNVMKELKKTCYIPRTTVLSSRDNMCVNSAVKAYHGTQLNLKCKQVRVSKNCKYFFGAERLLPSHYDLMDIEELVELGKENAFCPFYFQRNKKEHADIIFMPYNYLFELGIRESLGLEIENCVVLIDEAHNIESVCQDAKSYSFSTTVIDECLSDLKNIRISMEANNIDLKDEKLSYKDTIKNLSIHESILNSIKQYIKSFDVKSTPQGNIIKKLLPKELFNIFFEGSTKKDMQQKLLVDIKQTADPNTIITPENIQNHAMFLRRVQRIIEDDLGKFTILEEYAEILEIINILYKDYIKNMDADNFISNYKLFIDDVEDKNAKDKKNVKVRTLFLHCMNPGFGFLDIKEYKPITTIITSGTLHPLESVEAELKTLFPIKLENKHVIDPCQVNFAIQMSSVSKKIPFRFDNTNKNNKEMQAELGFTILDLTKITPGGILVFFASYAYMNTCVNEWCEHGILSQLEKYKDVYKDTSDSTKNKIIIREFKQSSHKKGGILFSVVRGTSSEGIDFADDLARLVIVVGIPYPNLGDTKVTLKKEFLDESIRNTQKLNNNNIRKLSSNDWYTQSATKAVNQALGRVIRHIDDYGSIILIDNRYSEMLRKQCFSKWLRERARVFDDVKVVIETKTFFENMPNYIKEKRAKKLNENKDFNESGNGDEGIAKKRSSADDDEESSGSFSNVFNLKKSMGKKESNNAKKEDNDRFKSTTMNINDKPANNISSEVNNILPVSSLNSLPSFIKKPSYNANFSSCINNKETILTKPTDTIFKQNNKLEDSSDFLLDESLFKFLDELNDDKSLTATGVKETPNNRNQQETAKPQIVQNNTNNNINVVINVNTTTNNIQMTTPKREDKDKPEFDTDQFMRKLAHFKENNELENILEKYGIKVKLGSQEGDKADDKGKINSNNLRDEVVKDKVDGIKKDGKACPICYEAKE
jgi:regulator of telomere elongation helicase 1